MGSVEWEADSSFSLAMNKHVDAIYKKIYPIDRIERLRKDGSNPHILDQEFGIDTRLHLKNGQIITVQEKMRRNSETHWQDFTLEYMSNSWGTKGEHFKLSADIYFYGYGDLTTGIHCAFIFKTSDFKNALASGEIRGARKDNTTHSTANFDCYKFSDFKDSWFVYKMEWDGKERSNTGEDGSARRFWESRYGTYVAGSIIGTNYLHVKMHGTSTPWRSFSNWLDPRGSVCNVCCPL